MMRSGNPVLNDNTFTHHIDLTGDDRMTLMGTVHKTGLLLTLLVVAAAVTWNMVFQGQNSEGVLQVHPSFGPEKVHDWRRDHQPDPSADYLF